MSDAYGQHVHCSDGRRLRLGPMLKAGGAGSIHLLPESPHQVAKLYHRHMDTAEYEQKIEAMLALSPEMPDIHEAGRRYVQIAWPQAALRDARGRFLGFVMPAVDVKATSELEVILQERQARAAGLPTGLGAKVTLAANLAAVVAELHRRGHHVVDLKPVNLRFYPGSLYMAMLDCDGFSIRGATRRFTAEQFTPDYLAPEFQRPGLDESGEEPQDRFALAVVVFQLLNFGLHPYSGRPADERVPTDIPGRIAAGLYAYGLRPQPRLQPSPVSAHASLPAELRQLFDRAFEATGTGRPGAQDWADALRHYAQRASGKILTCAQDPAHQHFAGGACAACTRAALLTRTAKQAAAQRPPPAWTPRSPRTPAGNPPPRQPLRPRWTTRRATPTPLPQNRWIPTPGYNPTPSTPPPPNWPRNYGKHPGRLTGSYGSTASGGKFGLALIVLVIILARACGGPPANRSPATSPPQTGTAFVPAVQTPPPTAYVIERARIQMDAVARALVENDEARRRAALQSLSKLALNRPVSLGPREQPERETMRALFERADLAEQLKVRDQLTRAVAMRPRDPEAAFFLGWIHLLNGDPAAAQTMFVRSVLADPGHAAAWYGYAISHADPGISTGAIAEAELFSPDEVSAERVRSLFQPVLIQASRDDPVRFRHLSARARQIAARLDGRPLDPETAALAREPLPAR